MSSRSGRRHFDVVTRDVSGSCADPDLARLRLLRRVFLLVLVDEDMPAVASFLLSLVFELLVLVLVLVLFVPKVLSSSNTRTEIYNTQLDKNESGPRPWTASLNVNTADNGKSAMLTTFMK